MANRESVLSRMRAMHNDIGIVGGTTVVRLIGFHEDESDYYHTVQDVGGAWWYESAVGSFVTLRGRLPEDEYRGIESVFSLNGSPPSEQFEVTGEQP